MSTRLRVTPFIFDCFILNNRIICPVAEEVVREAEVQDLAVGAAPKGIFKLQVQKDVVTTRMRLACTCWQGNRVIWIHLRVVQWDAPELVRDRMEEVPRCLGSEPVQLDVT